MQIRCQKGAGTKLYKYFCGLTIPTMFLYILAKVKVKGRIIRNIQNTGSWNNSGLDSEDGS